MPISGDARRLLILSVHRLPTLTRPSFLGNGTTLESQIGKVL